VAKYRGPSHDIGQAMCCKLLDENGKEISRTSVIPLSVEDRNNEITKQLVKDFDEKLKKSLGDRAEGIPINPIDGIPEYEPYWDESMNEE
jgi:hypothetical protein